MTSLHLLPANPGFSVELDNYGSVPVICWRVDITTGKALPVTLMGAAPRGSALTLPDGRVLKNYKLYRDAFECLADDGGHA